MTHYPHYRQRSTNDCGPYSLKAVAKTWRMPNLEIDDICRLAGMDQSGISLAGLQRAAEAMDFATLVVHDLENIHRLPTPSIAHLTTNSGNGHFVVIHKIDQSTALVADPSRDDLCERPLAELRSHCNAIMLLAPRPYGSHSLQTRGATAGAYVRSVLRRHKTQLLQAVGLSVIGSLLPIAALAAFRGSLIAIRQEHEVLLVAFALGLLCIAGLHAGLENVKTCLVSGVRRCVLHEWSVHLASANAAAPSKDGTQVPLSSCEPGDWISRCGRRVHQLWSNLRRGRLPIDPRELRGTLESTPGSDRPPELLRTKNQVMKLVNFCGMSVVVPADAATLTLTLTVIGLIDVYLALLPTLLLLVSAGARWIRPGKPPKETGLMSDTGWTSLVWQTALTVVLLVGGYRSMCCGLSVLRIAVIFVLLRNLQAPIARSMNAWRCFPEAKAAFADVKLRGRRGPHLARQ